MAIGQALTTMAPWLVLAACSALFLALGSLQWPGLHWDSALYATPVLSVANGEGWLFDSYAPQLIKRADRIYDFHGVLHVLVFGAALRTRDYGSLLFWSGVINCITFLVYAYLFHRVLQGRGILRLPLAILFALCSGVVTLSLQGRPEQLIPLLVSAPFLCFCAGASARFVRRVSGVVAGLVFLTSPLPGFFYGLGIIVLFALHTARPGLRVWREAALLLLTAAVTCALVIQIACPFSFLAWLRNISGEGGRSMDFTPFLLRPLALDDFIYGLSTYAPLWRVFAIGCCVAAALALIEARRFGVLILVAAMVPALATRSGDYVYLGLIPAQLLVFLHRIKAHEEGIRLSEDLPAPLVFLSIFAGFYAFGIVRILDQGRIHLINHTGRSSALSLLRQHLPAKQHGDVPLIGFPNLHSPSLVTLGERGQYRMIGTQSFPRPEPPRGTVRTDELASLHQASGIDLDYYLMPQPSETLTYAPPPLQIHVEDQRFRLIADNWGRRRRGILGIPLRHDEFDRAYGVALYRRDPLPAFRPEPVPRSGHSGQVDPGVQPGAASPG